MADPSWWERQKQAHIDYMDRGGLFGTLFSMLPSETQASLRPWGGMLNPLEWTPGAGIRDAVQASGDTAHAVRNLDPWGTLAGLGYMGLGLLSAVVPPLRQPGKIAAPARAPMQNASKSANIHDPPARPPRPFEDDYPKGARADATGRLTHDIDGRELIAPLVVGRRMVGMGDSALPKEELIPLGTSLTGRLPEVLAPSEIGRGKVGRYREWFDPITGNRERSIALSNRLTAQQAPRVLGHEVGHVISRLAADIPTEGLDTQLRRVYNDLNGERWRLDRAAKTGEPVPRRYWIGPENLRYPVNEVPSELMAEAVRAYMADPNYLKTVAPDVAARVRQYANPNPQTNRYVQFNTLAAPAIPFGMLLPSILNEEERLP